MEDMHEILEELADSARGYQTFGEWFIHIAEYTEKLKEQARTQISEKKGVVISTFHSIKGLEFDKVFLMDVNEGTIPYRKAVTESNIEEERRLFYVGMTRARKELNLFYIKERHEKRMMPSRFLMEMCIRDRSFFIIPHNLTSPFPWPWLHDPVDVYKRQVPENHLSQVP